MTSWLDIYPQDLQKTAMAYDNFLREYRKEYDKAGIPEKHYSDIDEFVLAYQTNQVARQRTKTDGRAPQRPFGSCGRCLSGRYGGRGPGWEMPGPFALPYPVFHWVSTGFLSKMALRILRFLLLF